MTSLKDNNPSESLRDLIVPGTSRLLGLGRGSYGELWGTLAEVPSLQPLGRCDDPNDSGYAQVRFAYLGLPQLRGEDQVQIKQIACGSLHVIMLDFNGKCWALGDNGDGQLGIGSNEKTKAPTLISGGDFKDDEFIEQVATGGWSSAFINRHGHVFTCGNITRQYRQKYDYRETTQWVPRRATTLPTNALPLGDDDEDYEHKQLRFHKMACGNRFLLVQDQWTNQVYGFGKSEAGELSTLQTENPILSKVYYTDSETGENRLLNFPCKKLDAGERFSVVLDHNGALYTAGNKGDDIPTFTLMHELFNRDVRLVDVCCSWANFIGLDTNGTAHLGSVNSRGRTVKQLDFFGPVLQIGAGSVYMYARTNDKTFQVPERDMDRSNGEIVQLGTALQYEEGFDPSDREFVQLTGTYFTTVIHQAQLRTPGYYFSHRLHRLCLERQMCDVIVTFSVDE